MYYVHRPARSWLGPAGDPEGIENPFELSAPPVPPQEQPDSKWLALLPMLGSVSMVGFAFVVHSVLYLAVIAIMVLTMAASGFVVRRFQKKVVQKRWETIKQRYHNYASHVESQAGSAALNQRRDLDWLYPDPVCLRDLLEEQPRLWERRRDHSDFCFVRLGLGTVRARCPVVLEKDANVLDEPDWELAHLASQIVEKSASLSEAPVVIPLALHGCIALVGEPDATREILGGWLTSIAAFNSPSELRIIGYVPLEAARWWDWLKWLPHTRDPNAGDGFGRAHRAVSTDEPSFLQQIDDVVISSARRHATPALSDQSNTQAQLKEHLIVIVDGFVPHGPFGQSRNLQALMTKASGFGTTVIVTVRGISDIPAICDARVEVGNDGSVAYIEAGPQARFDRGVRPDRFDGVRALQLARYLAPLRLSEGGAGMDLSENVRLTELMGLAGPASVKPEKDWLYPSALRNGSHLNLLRVPIGRRDDGSVLMLDLKEAAAQGFGPHGLLVGATGFGKSELLRTLTLSLAATHAPSLLQFLLVDFKGGAAFAELASLPHVGGLVTNLADEIQLVDRVQQALTGELTRRQELLGKAGEFSSIRDYHSWRASGHAGPDLPYLLVIVDEFGELLAVRPDFLDTFLTVARLGRSLGVHLLLSTQRLDEGRIRMLEPHLRFRLCLRTHTAAESRSVLGVADAFQLPPVPGLGYLKVDSLELFKSALVTLPCRQGATDETTMPVVVPFGLSPPVRSKARTDSLGSDGTDLSQMVQKLKVAGSNSPEKIWLDPLPSVLNLGAIEVQGHKDGRRAVLGLLDMPRSRKQVPLWWDLRGARGNLAVVGAPRAGKSTLLSTAISALIRHKLPNDLQIYCLDFGGGELFNFEGLPHMSAIAGKEKTGAASRLLGEVHKLLDERSSAAQVKRHAMSEGTASESNRLPTVVLFIDNVAFLHQTTPELESILAYIATSGLQHDVHVALSANRWLDIRPQLLDAFGTRFELHLSDPAESMVGRMAALALPADVPGRGITKTGGHFQIALPSYSQSGLISLEFSSGEIVADAKRRAGGQKAPPIIELPLSLDSQKMEVLCKEAGSDVSFENTFVLGVSEFRLRPVEFDPLKRKNHLLKSPLAPLSEFIPFASDVDFHMILARRVAGSQRTAFEPFSQRLQEAHPVGVVLSGSPDEGPLAGGIIAKQRPVGRAMFVDRSKNSQLIQCLEK